MPSTRFILEHTADDALRRHHLRTLGDLDGDYDWDSLDPSPYPEELVARARVGWTENAFNEYCTAAALCEMLQAMIAANVPIELWTLASTFPTQEILHVELCTRIADRLGGAAPLRFDARALLTPMSPRLTPLQRASELVVRYCCVGEAFSMPMLRGCMASATHPVTRAVLTQIVRDEVMHGRFGWFYLDWLGERIDEAERERLGAIASAALRAYQPIWANLHSTVRDGITSEGYRIEHVTDMGWMEASQYRERAELAVRDEVIAPLAERGIPVDYTPTIADPAA